MQPPNVLARFCQYVVPVSRHSLTDCLLTYKSTQKVKTSCQGESSPYPSVDLDSRLRWLLKSGGDYLVQSNINDEFHEDAGYLPNIWAKLWDNALPCNVEESFTKHLDPDADDFQNLISSSLSTDTHLVKLSRRCAHEFLSKDANRQTDRKTDEENTR